MMEDVEITHSVMEDSELIKKLTRMIKEEKRKRRQLQEELTKSKKQVTESSRKMQEQMEIDTTEVNKKVQQLALARSKSLNPKF